jgi:hypothetical protein
MPAQFWESTLNSPGLGAGAALASSVILTDISPAPQLVLPANFLYVGQALRLTANGVFSTTATPTLLLGFYFGGVAGGTGSPALAINGAVATASGVTNVPWRLELTSTVRAVGSGTTGSIISQGFQYLGTTVAAWAVTPLPITAMAAVGVDTTKAQAITVGAQWGASSASNTITCHQFLVEALN